MQSTLAILRIHWQRSPRHKTDSSTCCKRPGNGQRNSEVLDSQKSSHDRCASYNKLLKYSDDIEHSKEGALTLRLGSQPKIDCGAVMERVCDTSFGSRLGSL